MIRTLSILILAALVAAPAFAGATAVVTGEIQNASTVTTSAQSVGAPSGTHVINLLTIRSQNSPAVLLRFAGEILPDGSIRLVLRDGSERVVGVGDRVRLRAVFNCARPGGDDPCHLFVVAAR